MLESVSFSMKRMYTANSAKSKSVISSTPKVRLALLSSPLTRSMLSSRANWDSLTMLPFSTTTWPFFTTIGSTLSIAAACSASVAEASMLSVGLRNASNTCTAIFFRPEGIALIAFISRVQLETSPSRPSSDTPASSAVSSLDIVMSLSVCS